MTNPVVKFIAQNQAFDITVSGLVPLTRHYVYFERQLQPDTNCAPKGGVVGASLITDISGKLSLTFYYGSGLPAETNSIESAQALANAVAGVKEIIVANINSATLDFSYINNVQSYARTYIDVDILPVETVTTEVNQIIQQAYVDYNPPGW